MNVTKLKTWLDSDDTELVNIIVTDIQRHVSSLESDGNFFYGYALLPGDYCTQPNPTSIIVAFNRESDIAPENTNDIYYRYSVDEWPNYIYDGFDNTNSKLQSLFDRFNELHAPDPNEFQLDEYEIAYIAKIDRAILKSLIQLKDIGTFNDDMYLIIWYPDSDYEIMNKSAKTLNNSKVYAEYAQEFE